MNGIKMADVDKELDRRAKVIESLTAQLAEEQAALLHMEADRDGCLKIMFSSQHGKEIRELQIEVTRLRSQLERSPCGHLKAEWVAGRGPSAGSPLSETPSYCAGCKRESDAVRRGRLQEAEWWDDHSFANTATLRQLRADRLAEVRAPTSQPTTEHVKEGEK